jgi:hypothetical protein
MPCKATVPKLRRPVRISSPSGKTPTPIPLLKQAKAEHAKLRPLAENRHRIAALPPG